MSFRPAICSLLLLTVFLSGAASTPAQAGEIRLGPPPGNLLPEARQVLEAVVKLYGESHPGTTVVLADGDRTFDAAVAEKDDLGDVLFLTGGGYGQASTMALYAERGYLVPLDERLNQPSFNKKDYFANLWEGVGFKGQTWAVPVLVRSWGVGVDASRWDPETIRAGLKDWDTFAKVLAALQVDSDSDGTADTTLIRTLQSPVTFWETLFLAYGGNPNDPASYNPEGPAWRRATEQLSKLLQGNHRMFGKSELPLSYQPEASEIVHFVHNDSMDAGALPLLRRSQPDWVLLPAPGSAPLAPLDFTVAAVRRSTPEQEQAAWEFIEWLVSPQTMATIYPAASLTPLRYSVAAGLKDPDLRQFTRQVERMKFQAPSSSDSAYRTLLKGHLKSLFTAEKVEW